MSYKSASITKITRPNISGVLQRERLFALLDKGRNYTVTWVTGPGGAGKTTLAASYLDARGLQCLWYQMDEGDADIATFFHYMGTAAQKIYGTKQKPLPPFTPECLVNLPVFTRRYFEMLCGKLKATFTIVLDNYQEAPAGSGFHDMLVHGLDAVPEGINVLILSRNEPPPQFARMRANNKVNILGWEDIRFSLDESRDIVSMNNVTASAGTIAKLHEKTEGWAAGLVLMMECARRRRVDCEMLSGLTLPEVFDYFSNDILKKIDDETREFLLKTAFLPSFTAKTAEKLTGMKDSRRILSGLTANNYFTDMRLERDPVYQYHSLFREYLMAAARRTLPEETISELHHRAALLLEEEGEVEDAVNLYLKSSDWKEAARSICRNAQTYFSQGRSGTVRAWLESLPGEVVELDPWLLYWLGSCLVSVYHVDSRRCFEKAFEIFKSRNDRTGMLLSWSARADLAMFETLDSRTPDKAGPYDRWIKIYEDTLKSDEPFPSQEVETRVTMSMFNAMALRQPDHTDIELWEKRSFNLMCDCRDVNLRGTCGPNLVFYNMTVGNFSRARLLVEMLRGIAKSKRLLDVARINIKVAEVFYQATVSPETCIKEMVEGLRIAEESGIHIWDTMLLAHGILAAETCGHWEVVDKYLPMIEQHMETDTANLYITGYYNELLAMKSLHRGDYAQAIEYQGIAVKNAKRIRLVAAQAFATMGMATILCLTGNLDEAEAYLKEAHSLVLRIRSVFLEHKCLMLHAYLLFRKGDNEKALSSLGQALKLGSLQRYTNLVWSIPDVQEQLCNEALKAGIEVEYVQHIIRERRLLPPERVEVAEDWPRPLRIYTLGSFRMERDGEPVIFSGKAPQKPLALLKAILVFGGREVGEEELSDLLWPDADGDDAHTAFKTTLFRLRKLLGVENAILFQEGMAKVNREVVWVDAWAFEELLDSPDFRDKVKAGNALEMYRGEFLPGDADQGWTINYRERLYQKYLKSSSKLR